MAGHADHPVIIVAPLGQDAQAMAALLNADGIPTDICASLRECPAKVAPATEALLLTEEALEVTQLPSLMEALRGQPNWSELPLIVLSDGGETRRNTLLDLTAAASGTVTVLERPVRTATLLNAVRVALRSRRRQRQVRDLLEEQQHHARERARYAQELERALAQRTGEVTAVQQRLATAERMAAVGTLASGLAHDINNILLPLSARIDLVLQDSRLTGEHRTDLNVVVALIDHLRQMSRNLTLFSRDPDHEGIEGRTLLGAWATRVQSLIESSIAGDAGRREQWIKLNWDIPDDLPAVRIATHRLTQVMLNLVHNARDAVVSRFEPARGKGNPVDGRITIEARLRDDGVVVNLKVIDNGIGMTEEVRRRCIEPFFTTKDRPAVAGAAPGVSSGSGMGLALAHGLVQKAGGSLDIESAPGKGTTITMTLPVAGPDGGPNAGPDTGTHSAQPRVRPRIHDDATSRRAIRETA